MSIMKYVSIFHPRALAVGPGSEDGLPGERPYIQGGIRLNERGNEQGYLLHDWSEQVL